MTTSELEVNARYIEYGYQRGVMDAYEAIKEIAQSKETKSLDQLAMTIAIAEKISSMMDQSGVTSKEMMLSILEQLKETENGNV